MHPDCEAQVATFLGRDLKPSEARDATDAVSLHMRLLARKDPQAWMAMSSQGRLEAGAKAAAQAIVDELKLRQKRVALQIAAHDRIENALNEAFDRASPEREHWWQRGRLPVGTARLRAVSRMLAFDPRGGLPGVQSVETSANSLANEALGRLLPLWGSAKGLAHLFENRKGVSDLVHELFGEDTGNAAAKAGAKAWFQVTDELRNRSNAAGSDIGKLHEDEWHYPQTHSQARIAQAGLERWQADTLALLDRDKYLHADGTRMSDGELLEEFLPRAYDSIITDGQNKTEAEFKRQTARGAPTATYTGTGLYGQIAGRNAGHRAIFFKDADAYLTYQGLYGERSLWSTLTGHIRAITRDIALMETLGPNAEQTFRYFNERTKLDEIRMDGTARDQVNRAAAFNDRLFDYVAGKRGVVSDDIAAVGQAFRNFETAAKLGRVVITALGDEAGMAVTAFANRVPWSGSFMREFKYLSPTSAADRAVVKANGVGINSMIGGLNRFGQEEMQLFGGRGAAAAARNFTSKLATGVLNASGAEAMWDARRRALGSILMSSLGKLTREHETFGELNVADHGVLANKGVTENDWKVWKLAHLEDWGAQAHQVLTPKAVWAIPDEKLAELGEPTALKRHASTMLLGHILEETGMGVMDTGARERTRMTFGTQSGTAMGELARAAFLFKSFSFSMMMKHWARAAEMPTKSMTARYAATLLVTGTIMGALATQLRNLAAGKNPQNMAEPQFWGESVLRGGGLGFYGDFLYSEMTQHDTSLIPAIAGPLATEAESLWNLTGAAAFKATRGERTDEGAKLLRFARGEIPFLNMWYTQAAFDHLIWNEMQEAASPGYLDRMQSKAYGDRGTTWWWQPQESAPSSAPDIREAWQPERGREQLQQIAAETGLTQ